MNLENQPPVFVPDEVRAEIEQLSNMVWDYAVSIITASDTGIIRDAGFFVHLSDVRRRRSR